MRQRKHYTFVLLVHKLVHSVDNKWAVHCVCYIELAADSLFWRKGEKVSSFYNEWLFSQTAPLIALPLKMLKL